MAESLTFNWSGHSRIEGYYQHGPTRAYGGYQLVLEPELSVLDGLRVSARLELHPPDKARLFYDKGGPHRSFGLPLFYIEDGKARKDILFSPLFFDIARVFLDYETEFFRLQAGRSGRHFGLGVTYRDEEDPFNHWLSTLNQVFFYTEYGPFYIQPAALMEKDTFLGILQAGLIQNFWKLEGFYRYNTELSEHYGEAFGEYQADNWKSGLSFSYTEKSSSSFGLAFEGELDLPWSLKPRLQLKSGMASKGFAFHPGYDVGLLFQNILGESQRNTQARSPSRTAVRFPLESGAVGGTIGKDGSISIEPGEVVLPAVQEFSNTQAHTKELLIREGVLQDLLYFAPQVELSISESFKISPLILLAWQNDKDTMNYELDLKAQYSFEEKFFVLLTGGVLYRDKKWDFGLLSQAAVTF